MDWYFEQPPVTRTLLALAVGTTASCHLGLVSPAWLYFDIGLIMAERQLWRLVTCFTYFGPLGMSLVMRLYLLGSHGMRLEQGTFRGRGADFAFLLTLCAIALLLAASLNLAQLTWMGEALTFALIYVWARRNEFARLRLLGLPFDIRAPYMPWVMLMLSVSMGAEPDEGFAGIVVGHCYYFAADVYPICSSVRGGGRLQVVRTPRLFKWVTGLP